LPLALTNGEYDNTIRDLLGDDTAWSVVVEFPDDDLVLDGFRIEPYDTVQNRDWSHRLSHYVEAANRVAATRVGVVGARAWLRQVR